MDIQQMAETAKTAAIRLSATGGAARDKALALIATAWHENRSALMAANQLPPSPEHIPLKLRETFVEKKQLSVDYLNLYRDVYLLHKKLLHGELTEVKGIEIFKYATSAMFENVLHCSPTAADDLRRIKDVYGDHIDEYRESLKD